MDLFLVPINNVEDAPSDSYIIYDIPKSIYYCPFSKYTQFAQFFTYTNHPDLHLTMDLSSTQGHALLFDIDLKMESNFTNRHEILFKYFDEIFLGILKAYLTNVKNFTVILAVRPATDGNFNGGLHVHLPEFFISHDDYINFCSQIQSRCSYNLTGTLAGTINLDILANASLAKSGKPSIPQYYIPARVMYFDEKGNTHTFDLLDTATNVSGSFTKLKTQFKRRKDNENSFFKKLLLFDLRDVQNYLFDLMMPVITPFNMKPIYKIIYRTKILKYTDNDDEEYSYEKNDVVASFTLRNTLQYFFVKSKEMEYFSCSNSYSGIDNNNKSNNNNNNNNSTRHQNNRCENEWLKCQKYLKFNSFAITQFETKNRALNVWFRRYHSKNQQVETVPNIFQKINQMLQEDNFDFRKNGNPLSTILRYKQGYYFMPVFYALCQMLKMSSRDLIPHIRSTLLEANVDDMTTFSSSCTNDNNQPLQQQQELIPSQPEFLLKLLDKLEKIDPKLIENISQDFTVDTILYCGSNLNVTKLKMKEKIQSILKEMKGILLFISSSEDMADCIKRIQERYYPIMVVILPHSCKKPQRFVWNLTNEHWQECEKQSEVQYLVNTIWAAIQSFLERNHRTASDYKIQIQDIVSSVLSETNMDRKIVEINRHKWHIRTDDGILDLLTGHVGATVPEFYMSQKKISVPLNRRQLIALRDDYDENYHNNDDNNNKNGYRPMKLYKLLTSKRFFQTFLKKIFTDETEDLYETLIATCRYFDMDISVAIESDDGTDKKLNPYYISSMLNFYLHICKYNSFEYERVIYFLAVMSSLLIATNYARKFFILKGNTRNGKSKLFQMIARVFGGYSHTIRAVNLQNSAHHHGLNAQPELASSLFSCRVVIVEEMSGKLNENLVKEITGNSTTSFRNLYEQNSGGIPTAKLFASTNGFPDCTATEAFKDRVVAFPFEAVFANDILPKKTSEQVLQGKYLLDTSDSVIEDSYIGFFLMMYLYLIEHMNYEDGTVHYPPEPEALVEFKAYILFMTDIYIQFKQYLDIQIMPGAMTTFNDLKSAVRYFLKTTRNNTVQESEIIMRFDEEYGRYKRTEVNLGFFSNLMTTAIPIDECFNNNKNNDVSTFYDPECSNPDLLHEERENYDNYDETDLENDRDLNNCHDEIFYNNDVLDFEPEEDNEDQSNCSNGSSQQRVNLTKRKNNNPFSCKKQARKKRREVKQQQNSIVYYENIIINDLKKTKKSVM